MLLQKQMELLEEYKAEKKTFTNGKIEALSNKMVYVETSVRYELEEFSSYKQIKLNFRPEKDSTLKLLFLHTLGKKHVILLVGLVENPEEEKRLILDGTDEPDSLSVYTLEMKFGDDFVQTMEVDGISGVNDVINKVPFFCQS